MKNTKINLKNIIQKSSIIIVGVLLAVASSYVSAMARPANITTVAPTVLNTGNTSQSKAGLISVLGFMAGDYATTSTSNYTIIDNLGIMAIGKSETPGASKGISLDIAGTTGILGTIRSEDLKSSGSKEVCADPDGKIVFCTKEEEYTSTSQYGPSYYGLMVPDGVTEITVEIYGAGGSGFAKNNKDTGADNGQSSYILGDGVSVIAEGGQAADLATAGGKGGKVSISGATLVSKYEDGDGSAPGSYNANPSQVGSSSNCSGTNYSTIKGANGNVGGKGGKPYNGSNANGGTAGSGAPTSGSGWNFNIVNSEVNPPTNRTDCNHAEDTSDQFVPSQYKNNRPGGNGADGASYGAGGAGFGGKGGLSAVYSGNINNCANCLGGQSSAGGGAGAYVKATINTTPGATFYLKVGNAGKYDSSTYFCSSGSGGGGGTNICLDQLGGGALPGAGAPGYIKIKYNN